MFNVKLDDIENLNKKRKNILELENEIQELKEVKRLKISKKEEIELQNKIKRYSTYNSKQIGSIIAKLMTSFEGIEYWCLKKADLVLFLDYDYVIEPKIDNVYKGYVYPRYEIKNRELEKPFFNTDKDAECYMFPAGFKLDSNENKNIEYIELFIDYLYKRRCEKVLEIITELELENILQEFLGLTKYLQQQRKIEIADKIGGISKRKKREEFEKACVIDRKLIFNSLAYIINHFEENMTASQETEQEWVRSTSWSELKGYHKLTIKWNNKCVSFKTKVDSSGCYPDEEYCGVYIDINKDTDICFFDIKRKLLPILNNSSYAISFINKLEEMYLEKQNISLEDINLLLVSVSNEKKEEQRVLKKKN